MPDEPSASEPALDTTTPPVVDAEKETASEVGEEKEAKLVVDAEKALAELLKLQQEKPEWVKKQACINLGLSFDLDDLAPATIERALLIQASRMSLNSPSQGYSDQNTRDQALEDLQEYNDILQEEIERQELIDMLQKEVAQNETLANTEGKDKDAELGLDGNTKEEGKDAASDLDADLNEEGKDAELNADASSKEEGKDVEDEFSTKVAYNAGADKPDDAYSTEDRGTALDLRQEAETSGAHIEKTDYGFVAHFENADTKQNFEQNMNDNKAVESPEGPDSEPESSASKTMGPSP